MKRKLPRLIDLIVTAKDREVASKNKRKLAADSISTRPIVYGEPLPIDRSAIVWPKRRSSHSAQDQAFISGESYPIAD